MPDIIEMYQKQLFEMEQQIKEKQELLQKLEQQLINFAGKIKYYVEMKWNGFHIEVHKKDGEVKIFSVQLKDITKAFPTLVEAIKKLSDKDFIVDGEIVPYDDGKALGRNELMKFLGKEKHDDSHIRLHVWDIVYYDGKDLTDLPLYERKAYLDKLKFSDRITNTPYYIVSNPTELKEAVKKMAERQNSEGAVIKDANSKYQKGTCKGWWKYRHLLELKVINLKKHITKDGKAYNYEFGILVNKNQLKVLDPKYIVDTPRGKVLKLGKTFNTKLDVPQYSTFSVIVEEVWRHETKDGIHYSIHKPRVKDVYHPSENKPTSTIKDLEDLVTSVGVAVKEFSLVLDLTQTSDPEGKRAKEIKDWPKWVQEPLKVIMNKKLWLPFVIQHHYRGHKVRPDENLPPKYKYNLLSVHSDLRCFLADKIESMKEGEVMKYEEAANHDGVCFGITINTPPSVDKPDEFTDDAKNILCEFKLPIPREWLYVEGIFPPGGIGATPKAPAVMVIVAKGEYTCYHVHDHKIVLQFRCRKGKKNMDIFKQADDRGIYIKNTFGDELKQLHVPFSFTINHIGDKHLILLNAVKNQTEKDVLNKVSIMTSLGYSRPQIAQELGISKITVYRYQKALGLI